MEQFNLMVNSKGVVVHSELKGALQMKAYLSGMPECKLGLNDKTMFARQVWPGQQRCQTPTAADTRAVCTGQPSALHFDFMRQ